MPLALSVGIILFFGFLGAQIFERIKLPPLLGMLLSGMLVGPYGLDWLSDSLLMISYDLRMIGLIIILLRAGFGLNHQKIKRSGRLALWMAFLPGLIEGFGIALLSMWLFNFTFVQGGILGFVIAAVSPAVVVPAMIQLMDKRKGMNKNIPVTVLSAASLDDVLAITLFSMFMGIYSEQTTNLGMQILNIPVAILLGVLSGLLFGTMFVTVFNRLRVRDSKKVVVLIALSLFLVALEDMLQGTIMFAGLLAVMSLGIGIAENKEVLAQRLSIKFNKIWVFAEIFLFVLVGAAVDPSVITDIGVIGVVVIALGLLFRSAGVLMSTLRSQLNKGERAFLVVAYWPKATVQAAIGSVPLSVGVAGGEIILALSVLSILLTAPLGAIMIDRLANKVLHQETVQTNA